MGDGTVEVTRPLADGVVRTTGSYPTDDGPGFYVVDLALGIYAVMFADLRDGDIDPSSRTTYAFEMAPPDMPTPAAGARISLPVAVFEAGELRADTQTYTAGEPFDLTIGGCAYPALEVAADYLSEPGSREGFVWIPALGISYLAWWEDADGTREDYAPVRIGAVR